MSAYQKKKEPTKWFWGGGIRIKMELSSLYIVKTFLLCNPLFFWLLYKKKNTFQFKNNPISYL